MLLCWISFYGYFGIWWLHFQEKKRVFYLYFNARQFISEEQLRKLFTKRMSKRRLIRTANDSIYIEKKDSRWKLKQTRNHHEQNIFCATISCVRWIKMLCDVFILSVLPPICKCVNFFGFSILKYPYALHVNVSWNWKKRSNLFYVWLNGSRTWAVHRVVKNIHGIHFKWNFSLKITQTNQPPERKNKIKTKTKTETTKKPKRK